VENLRVVEICNVRCHAIVSEDGVRNLFWTLDRNGRFFLEKGDLSIAFVSKKKIEIIHGQFLGDDSPTDVVTFQGDSALNFAGEIVVCPSYALEQSRFYGTTFEEEIKLYLVHGYLHLCGLKDKSKEEIGEMREGERYCMNFLNSLPLKISPKGQ
jgi:probable rRNA maturation factor